MHPSMATGDPSPVARRLVDRGTYETGKSRVRILLAATSRAGFEVSECHAAVWRGVRDKGTVTGRLARLRLGLRWLVAYPGLVARDLRLPRHGAVLVPCTGQLDVLVPWPFARLRRATVYWDVFISLYDTVVSDRRLAGPGSPVARAVYALDWLALRAGGRPFIDTAAHARYVESLFRLRRGAIGRVMVGAESGHFRPLPPPSRGPGGAFAVLFHGQFIPLHGIETVIRAAHIRDHCPLRMAAATLPPHGTRHGLHLPRETTGRRASLATGGRCEFSLHLCRGTPSPDGRQPGARRRNTADRPPQWRG